MLFVMLDIIGNKIGFHLQASKQNFSLFFNAKAQSRKEKS